MVSFYRVWYNNFRLFFTSIEHNNSLISKYYIRLGLDIVGFYKFSYLNISYLIESLNYKQFYHEIKNMILHLFLLANLIYTSITQTHTERIILFLG